MAYAVLHRPPDNPLGCGSKKQRKKGISFQMRKHTTGKHMINMHQTEKQYARLHLMNGIAGIFHPIPLGLKNQAHPLTHKHFSLTQHLFTRHVSALYIPGLTLNSSNAQLSGRKHSHILDRKSSDMNYPSQLEAKIRLCANAILFYF